MIVVADSGPLMALAKAQALDLLFDWCRPVQITPAVYQEAIVAGLALGAADASLLNAAFKSGELIVRRPKSTALPTERPLGDGEQQSVLLAIDVLKDTSLATGIKGTLGVLVSAAQCKQITPELAIEKVNAISMRPDVWLSSALCERVIKLLERIG